MIKDRNILYHASISNQSYYINYKDDPVGDLTKAVIRHDNCLQFLLHFMENISNLII